MDSIPHSVTAAVSARRRIASLSLAAGLLWSVPAVADLAMLAPAASLSDLCRNGLDDDGDGLVDKEDPDCQRCGDQDVDPGETCDDGNSINGDGCDRNCTIAACGNGIRTTGVKLGVALDRARSLVAGTAATTDVRAQRRNLRGAKALLGDVTRMFRSAVRKGRIELDVGLRLLDLGRGTRRLMREQR